MLALVATLALSANWIEAAITCSKVAAPTGSDSNAGTLIAPYRTAQKLASSLTAGQTGCLRTGTFREDLKLTIRGTATARIKVRSYPNERDTVVGRLYVVKGANFATVSNLDIQRYRPHRDSLYVFLHLDDVEPTNNSSERDLRPSVIHRKVIGGFRSEWGAEASEIQSSILATARKQGQNLLDALPAVAGPSPLQAVPTPT